MNRPSNNRFSLPALLTLLIMLLGALACRSDSQTQRLRPRQLRDVPARALAFTFQADVDPPAGIASEEPNKLAPVQQDFDTRRKEDALLRTVVSPDGQRALALYSTADDPPHTFRIDLYSADGKFLRNLTPPNLAVVFQDSVGWSPDSSFIAFVGRRSLKAQPGPTPPGEEEPLAPAASPLPAPSVMPAFAPLAVFDTEQVYLCNRDGYDLKPLTMREGLIYFGLSWAPDGHALAALACREGEWDAREKEFKTPAGRPRLISISGEERLLDDQLAEAPPVWAPDSSKVATSFGTDIGIYDAASKAPSQARISLREHLLTASAAFDEKSSAGKKKATAAPPVKPGATPPISLPIDTVPFSFNPIVRLEWPLPEKLYVETAYISLRSELIKTFSRWHMLTLSPQAAVLGRG
ncbi:MAG: hypothetical protein DMF71_02145 [Acidobacteria bacterium]|nr:MAG: hypothetical protein DMF71_02145 [Acidobacteriota bacterium]